MTLERAHPPWAIGHGPEAQDFAIFRVFETYFSFSGYFS
jgi:hypothetical protein